jgi:hypothetical protein
LDEADLARRLAGGPREIIVAAEELEPLRAVYEVETISRAGDFVYARLEAP